MGGLPDAAELSARQRGMILAALSLVLFAAIIDVSAMNVALPSIGRELGASDGQLQWIASAYMLALAAVLMFAGSMGDRFGRRRALLVGLVLFAAGSLLGTLASSPAVVILGRAVQGLGGASMPPTALAIISNVFLDARGRARAIGTWGAVMGVALALGPLLGGVLTELISWRAVFGINLPLVAVAIAVIVRVVPETRAGTPRRFDAAGQLLAVVLLLSLTVAIIRIGEGSAGSAEMLLLGVAAVALIAFIAVERRTAQPMLELRFFHSRPFAIANVIAMLVFGAYAGFQFVTALYLQGTLGLSALQAGLLLLPMAAANAAMAAVSGRMVAAWGARPPVLMLGVILAGAAAVLLASRTDGALVQYVIASILFGGGMGAANAALTTVAMAGMPRAQAGVAGATLSTGRQTGQALGVALFGALLNAGTDAGATPERAALPGWWIVLGIALLVLILGHLAGTPAARRSEQRIAELIGE